VRWRNALLSAIGVWVGAWWVGSWRSWDVFLAALTAATLTAVANTWNDIADADIDRLAHPERPLPSGALSAATAQRTARIAMVASVLSSAAVSVALALLTLLVLLLMYLYSPWIKRLGLPGNVLVAVLASLPFLYGAWAAGDARAGVYLVAIAAPLHLAREIAKDIDDEPADRGRRRTLPVAHGISVARIMVAGSLVLFAVALVPIAVAHVRFALAMMPALIVAALAALASLRGRRGAPALFKAAMLLSMLALVISQGSSTPP
jgi:geranylgeranylglycerol-phosphate geranylgeranyltransferase